MRNPWGSEAEMAEAVKVALRELGWTVYPETCGWDLFAVAGDSVPACPEHVFGTEPAPRLEPGTQLGVELKLDAGTVAHFLCLFRQAAVPGAFEAHLHPRPRPLSRRTDEPRPGPDIRLAASSRFADDGQLLLHYAGVAAVRMTAAPMTSGPGIKLDQVTGERLREKLVWAVWKAPRHSGKRHKVPELVIEVPAGVPSPRTASARKVEAVRLYLRLLDGEELTVEDLGGHRSRFVRCGWARNTGRRRGRLSIYELGPGKSWARPPVEQWPEIVEALRAKDQGSGDSSAISTTRESDSSSAAP